MSSIRSESVINRAETAFLKSICEAQGYTLTPDAVSDWTDIVIEDRIQFRNAIIAAFEGALEEALKGVHNE